MAEENTAENLEEDESEGASEESSVAEPDAVAEDAVEATEPDSSAAEEDTEEVDSESGSTVDDTVPESANEPSIGSEVPVMQPPHITSNGVEQPIADISMILDIPVTLSMEIGQTRISIEELLKLGKDSVIELQRMADEPMDVLVNGTLVAHGEAVVVGDRFGIRLTDVISPQERLRKFT